MVRHLLDVPIDETTTRSHCRPTNRTLRATVSNALYGHTRSDKSPRWRLQVYRPRGVSLHKVYLAPSDERGFCRRVGSIPRRTCLFRRCRLSGSAPFRPWEGFHLERRPSRQRSTRSRTGLRDCISPAIPGVYRRPPQDRKQYFSRIFPTVPRQMGPMDQAGTVGHASLSEVGPRWKESLRTGDRTQATGSNRTRLRAHSIPETCPRGIRPRPSYTHQDYYRQSLEQSRSRTEKESRKA